MTSRSTARRAGSLVAALGVLLSMFLVASPAQAAPIVNLTASATTITLGESVTLAWSASQDTTELTASGAWTGSKGLPNGAEALTPTEAGTFTYTLTAGNDTDPDSVDSVTVTVEPVPITPNAVTFPDPCTVVIPTTPNVSYFVDYGDGDVDGPLPADTYDGLEFSGGDLVNFFAEANDGFTLADGATDEWEYAAPDSCFEIDEGPELVSTTVACGSVTFTNTTDESLEVEVYGFDDEVDFEPVDAFTLAGGASHTVETDFADIIFGAFTDGDDEDDPTQIRVLEVPQDCGDGDGNGDGDDDDADDHPTVAPAAGLAAR